MAECRPDRDNSETPMTSRTYGPLPPETSGRALINQLTAERDRYAAMLLAAEQELAKRPVDKSDDFDDLEWYREALLAVVNSRSWRVTKPLRTFGRLARGHSDSQTEA